MKLLIPPPVQLVIMALAMWGVSKIIPLANFYAPVQMKLSTVIIGIGIIIEIIAIATFFHSKTTVNPMKPQNVSKLVITGIYQYSRNPMYLSIAIILAGWALRLGNPVNSLLWVGFLWLITVLQIKPEEEVLQEKFGTEYADYCQRVRRWI